MDIGLVIFYIWISGFVLIALPAWVYFSIDTWKRERLLDKGKDVRTITGNKATCSNDILADMLLDAAPVFIAGFFWPITLMIILLRRKEIFS